MYDAQAAGGTEAPGAGLGRTQSSACPEAGVKGVATRPSFGTTGRLRIPPDCSGCLPSPPRFEPLCGALDICCCGAAAVAGVPVLHQLLHCLPVLSRRGGLEVDGAPLCLLVDIADRTTRDA